MGDLIDLTRAKRSIPEADPGGADDADISVLITAASRWIRQYLRRGISQYQYDEIYEGTNEVDLVLTEYPIQAIYAVRFNYQTILQVKNTDTSKNFARARVGQQTSDLLANAGLILSTNETEVGVVGTLLKFSTYPTLNDLVGAVNAQSGWTAQLTQNAYGTLKCAEILATSASSAQWDANAQLQLDQPPRNAKNTWAEFKAHVDEISDYEVLRAKGVLKRRYGYWPMVPYGWRILYLAGCSTTPEDLQECCAQIVSLLFKQQKRDPAIRQIRIYGVSFTALWPELPVWIQATLNLYKRHVF